MSLNLGSTANTLQWEIYTADMRKVADGTESSASRAVFSQTASLASGIYIARIVATENGISRQAIQKLIITR